MSVDSYKYPGLDKKNSIATKVEIKISCNLPKFDKLSNTDSKVFIFIEKKQFNELNVSSLWSLMGSTEIIKNNNNPVFNKSFTIDYYFETIQNLRFMVMDMDSNSDEWAKNDFIGYIDVSLADIIKKSVDNVYSCDLLTNVPPGIEVNNSKAQSFAGESKIYLRIEDNSESRYDLKFNISGENLDKKDTFGKSDPFIIISRINENGSPVKVYETPIIKNTLNPKWDSFVIPEKEFNNGNSSKVFLYEVFDWDRDKSNDLIGTFKATTRELFEKKEFEVINEKKQNKGKDYKNSGIIKFNMERIRNVPYTFIEFPCGGTEIAVSFAIDFTGSNGLQHLPTSLHYNKPNYDPNNFYTLNDYEKAISSVGYVLQPYDTNKYIEVYGYGGKFFGKDTVEFDCALTGDQNNPSVFGVNGVLDVYHKALQTVYLSGPTNFAPIIRKITQEAKKDLPPPHKNNPLSKYFILTILTDGVISDMEKTKEAIIDAADAPLSIIIIGIGERKNFEDMKDPLGKDESLEKKFDSMIELDSDDKEITLKNKDKVSKRDIVQFLPLIDYIANPELLAAETLKEVPK
eukprot:jgi/Orpsp1_1/1182950/evm.model.c7180000083251.1